jgi:hypothetical protein
MSLIKAEDVLDKMLASSRSRNRNSAAPLITPLYGVILTHTATTSDSGATLITMPVSKPVTGLVVTAVEPTYILST